MLRDFSNFEMKCPKCGEEIPVEVVKWEAMENMALFLAHELKNPVFALSSLVRRKYSSDGDLAKLVRDIDTIISNILILLGRGQPVLKKLNVEAVLMNSIDEIKSLFPAVEVITSFGAQKIFVRADEFLLRRVFSNIFQNAVESYSETHKTPKIIIKTVDFSKGIEIKVIDGGKGMDKETLQKVFTPFFTTKTRGTGIGMSVVKKVVEMHDGEINVKSEVGKGTEVIIRLPAEEF